MSRHLAPYTHKIVGVDISQEMVDYYNQRVFNQGIPPDQMRALCIQLTGADTDLDGQKFDVIVVRTPTSHLSDLTVYVVCPSVPPFPRHCRSHKDSHLTLETRYRQTLRSRSHDI